jgi:hypothetical protein
MSNKGLSEDEYGMDETENGISDEEIILAEGELVIRSMEEFEEERKREKLALLVGYLFTRNIWIVKIYCNFL